MSSFFKDLKATGKELAQLAQEHASELQKHASELQKRGSQLTEQLGKLPIGRPSDKKDCEFGDGPLGFRLEGALVVDVEAGGQADQLGVEVGDRLVEIAGYTVPSCDTGDVSQEEVATKTIRKWLREMPRPSRLTFRIPRPPVGGSVAEGDEAAPPDGEAWPLAGDAAPPKPSAAAPPQVAGSGGEGAGDVLGLPSVGSAEEAMTVAQSASPRAEASGPPAAPPRPPTSSAPAAEVTDLDALRRELTQTRASLDAERRKATKLLEEVGAVRARNKELLSTVTQREADGDAVRGAADAREQTLTAEVQRLREVLSSSEGFQDEAGRLRGFLADALVRAEAAEKQLAEMQATAGELRRQLAESTSRTETLEARARAAENRASSLSGEMQGYHQAHDAELDLTREEHRGQQAELERRLADQERHAASELQRLGAQLEDSQREVAEQRAAAEAAAAEAHAAAVEAHGARAAERAAKAEVEALKARGADALVDRDRRRSDDEDLPLMSPPTPLGGTEDAAILRERVEMLEKRCVTLENRCVTLQRKLSAQVLTASHAGHAGGGQSHPVWLPLVVRAFGPRAGTASLKVFSVPDKAMRAFTQRLLKHTMFLWAFYVHLFLLYTLIGSCASASAAVDSGGAAAFLDRQFTEAPSAQSSGVGGAGG